MPPVGLEPTHTRHEFLKLACLPIPSQGLYKKTKINLYNCQNLVN